MRVSRTMKCNKFMGRNCCYNVFRCVVHCGMEFLLMDVLTN
jgi:hypothetical protein